MMAEEWLSGAVPQAMLDLLQDRDIERKLRLFMVACCRPLWHLLEPRSREGVEMAEQFVDGLASEDERLAAAIAAANGNRDANSKAQYESDAEYRSGADDGDP